MGGKNYIPQAHDEFYAWQSNFFNRSNEKLSSFKIDPEEFKEVIARKSKFELAYLRASNPDAANRADRVERDEREAEYKAAIRDFVNANIRFNSRVSDYDRQYLGLTVADTKPTPAAVPHTVPVLTIDFSIRQQHTIRIKDSGKAGKAKPAGVKQCEIWHYIGEDEPKSDSLWSYAGESTNEKFEMNYDSSQCGKRVWYRARWVNTRSQHGAWGANENAIIA